MLQIFTLLKSIPLKYLCLGIVVIGLSVALAWQTYTKKDLELELTKANATIEQYEAAVDALQKTTQVAQQKADMAQEETADINHRLSKCYVQLEETRKSLDVIDSIMNNPDDPADATENSEGGTVTPAPAQPFIPITASQAKRGLEFVNKQLERVK